MQHEEHNHTKMDTSLRVCCGKTEKQLTVALCWFKPRHCSLIGQASWCFALIGWADCGDVNPQEQTLNGPLGTPLRNVNPHLKGAQELSGIRCRSSCQTELRAEQKLHRLLIFDTRKRRNLLVTAEKMWQYFFYSLRQRLTEDSRRFTRLWNTEGKPFRWFFNFLFVKGEL